MEFYLSEIATDFAREYGSFLYENAIDAVVSFCEENNFICWRSFEFSSYKLIEERIDRSEIFVALIDKYWTSSTWKMHEYTYASGGSARASDKKGSLVKNKIVFLVDNQEFPCCLNGCPGEIAIAHTLSELRSNLKKLAEL
ncbi:MAG: hypothetical protein ACFB0C_16070 [Leptolyngbyaceae cyanobacterium]